MTATDAQMTDASNPIEAVRARLNEGRTWSHGSPGCGGESECVAVAAGRVLFAGGTFDAAWKVLNATAREQFPDRTTHPKRDAAIQLNDHPLTTWPEMDAFLDKAARRWDEQVRP